MSSSFTLIQRGKKSISMEEKSNRVGSQLGKKGLFVVAFDLEVSSLKVSTFQIIFFSLVWQFELTVGKTLDPENNKFHLIFIKQKKSNFH